MLKQLFPSLAEENKEKRKQSRTKTCKKEGSTSVKVLVLKAGRHPIAGQLLREIKAAPAMVHVNDVSSSQHI